MVSSLIKSGKRVKHKNILFWSGFGSFIYGLYFVMALLDQTVFSYMGVGSQSAVDLIKRLFWQDILLAEAKILFSYLLIGFLSGGILFVFWYVVLGIRFAFWRVRYKAIIMALSLLGSECFSLALSILKYPAVYNEFFYNRSPLRQEIQVFITSYLRPYYFLIAAVFLTGVFGYFLLKRLVWFSRFVLIGFLFSLGIVVILFVFVQRTYEWKLSGPNVIILGADSLRNDHISKELTPHLWSLVAKGVYFRKCYVSLPRTFPQWITYLKSQYPHTHGVRNMFPDKSSRNQSEGTVAEILRGRGYTTAVVSDFAGDVFSRFSAGFDVVSTPYFNFNVLLKQRCLEMHYFLLPYLLNNYGRQVFPELKEMANCGDPFLLEQETENIITRHKDSKALFLVLFSSATHFPYASPYPYYQGVNARSYRGLYKYFKPNIPGERVELPDDDLRQIRGLYQSSVKAFDDAVGGLLKFLQKKRLDKNTIFVILADHGEQLYENEWGQGHGEHLRGNAVLNVPFILCSPFHNFAGKVIDEPVRDIDVAPTILDSVGVAAPATMQGRTLLPLADGTTQELNLDIFAETGLWFTDKGDNFYQKQRILYPDIIGLGTIDESYNNEVVIKPEYRGLTTVAKHRMIRTKEYKLIYIPMRERIMYELYDLKNDPAELHNIVEQQPAVVAQLKKRLFSWMSQDKSSFWRNEYLVPYP